jgi:hypothetical protein
MDDLPNCTQVVIGRRSPQSSTGGGQDAVLLETNLDDVTGEQLGLAVSAALRAGAFDAWVSPVIMKKGRPGHVLHVLTDATLVEAQRAEIERVTGTMGIRATAVERWPVARSLEEVTVDGMTIRMKVSTGRAKPEFDDVAQVAAKTGAAPHEVASRAEEAWRVSQRPTWDPEGSPA